MANGGVPTSRATSGSTTGTTVSLRTVEIHFVTSPGAPANSHGIEGADWTLFDGTLYTDFGTTGADGKLTLQLAPGTTYTLEILGSAYEIRLRTAALEAATTLTGQQRRLRMLGYQLGNAGTNHNGVDNTMGSRTDRSILEFQADQGLKFDGVVGSRTRSSLTSAAGG